MARGPPTAGVVALVEKGNAVLLIQRGEEPSRGRWSFPGGGVEFGETLRDALVREMREETGLEVETLEIVDVLDVMIPPSGTPEHHFVVPVLRARIVGGELRPGEEVIEARWVEPKDCPPSTLWKARGRSSRICAGRARDHM